MCAWCRKSSPFLGSAFSPVPAAFQRPLLRLGLPALGQGGQLQADALKIVRGVTGECPPNLGGDDGTQHVQHLVALVAGSGQPLGRLPHLGWVVGPELVGDDLVHGNVQSGVHGLVSSPDFAEAGTEGLLQLRVLSLDQCPTLVFVGGVEKCQVDAVDLSRARRAGKRLASSLAHGRTVLLAGDDRTRLQRQPVLPGGSASTS